jgi:hemerythrin
MDAKPTPGAFWTEAYTVGDEAIDAQHKHIFALIKVLERADTSGDGARTADLVLAYLSRYLSNHFVEEERLMAEASYPHLDSHRKQHQACGQKLAELMATVEATPTPTHTYIGFVREWFHEHLLGSDQQYALWLHKTEAELSSKQQVEQEVCA